MKVKEINDHILRGKRVFLRLWNADDLDFVFALRSDEALNKYLDRDCPSSKDDVVKIIDTMMDGMFEKWYSWIIFDQERMNPMGSICLWNFSTDLKTAEIGYEIASNYQRKGFTHESVQLVVAYAFEKLGFQKLKAEVHKANLPSINLLLKNNFTLLSLSSKDEGTMNCYELNLKNR